MKKQSETGNFGSTRGYNFTLKSGTNAATLKQLIDWKPEVFNPERIKEGVLRVFGGYLDKKIRSQLPESCKTAFETRKDNLINEISAIFQSVGVDFDLNEQQLSSLNINNPIQLHAVDVLVKNKDELIQKLSVLLRLTEFAFALLNFISQLKRKIDMVRATLSKAQSHKSKLEAAEQEVLREDSAMSQSGNYDDKVALQRIDSKLQKLDEGKRRTTAKINRKEAQIETMQSSLDEIELFLKQFLDGEVDDLTPLTKLSRGCAKGLEIATDNSLEGKIRHSLSEPYKLMYRTRDATLERKLNKQRTINFVRTLARQWGLRVAICALVASGVVCAKNTFKPDEPTKQSDSIANTGSQVGTCDINVEAKKLYTLAIRAGLVSEDEINSTALAQAFFFQDNSSTRIKHLLEHPLFSKLLTKEQKKRLRRGVMTKQDYEVMLQKAISTSCGDCNDNNIDLEGDAQKAVKGYVPQFDSIAKLNSLSIFKFKIPQNLINLLKKEFGDLDIKFFISYKEDVKNLDKTTYLILTGNHILVNSKYFCNEKKPGLFIDATAYVPGGLQIPINGIFVGELEIPTTARNQICQSHQNNQELINQCETIFSPK